MDFGSIANGMFLGGNAFEAGRQQAKPRYYTRANWSGNGLANTGLQEIDMNKGLANPWDMYTLTYGTAEKDKDGKVTGFNFTDKFNQMNNSGINIGDAVGSMFGNLGSFGNRMLGKLPIQSFIANHGGYQGLRGNFDSQDTIA